MGNDRDYMLNHLPMQRRAFIGYDGWCWYEKYGGEANIIILIDEDVSYRKLMGIINLEILPWSCFPDFLENIFILSNTVPEELYKPRSQWMNIRSKVVFSEIKLPEYYGATSSFKNGKKDY